MNLDKLLRRCAPLVVITLILVFFARLTFSNLIQGRGDAYTYFYPYWHTASTALQHGRLPLWNELLFMGSPLLANSQVGLLYPPNWPAWLLAPDAPTAIKWSILLHLAWAGIGMYLLLNRPLKLDTVASLSGAILFTLGGQLTAHVEQINQLQGLSWLPWLYWLLLLSRERPQQWGPLLAGGLALQLLSGHSQTVFIGAAGMGVMTLWWGLRARRPITIWQRWRPLAVLLLAGAGMILLTLPQLWPTLELSSLSNRSGGLPFNEVISFSLHPALIGRALLPGYDLALNGEYIGTLGIAGLALAVFGTWTARQDRDWQAWIIVAALGLLLAPGGWNPVYWLLGRLPGFSLFRVPARWLVLWGLGASILAAYAVQHLSHRLDRSNRWLVAMIGGGLLALVASTFIAPQVAGRSAPGLAGPTNETWLAWVGTTGMVVIILWLWRGRRTGIILAGLAVIELFGAAQQMPYNRLTAPDAFTTDRPSIGVLTSRENDSPLPGRYLSMSPITYGPIDQPVIITNFAHQITGEAIDELQTAAKLKDIIAPNLGMVWNLASADGFDGGVLPLRTYTDFTRLILESEEPPPDGRLRENLTAIPAQCWLDLMGVRYLLTDRSADRWLADMYFDLSWHTPLARGESLTLDNLLPFEATALAIVTDMRAAPPGQLTIESTAATINTVFGGPPQRVEMPYALSLVPVNPPQVVESITITAVQDDMVLRGAALLDERTGAFQALTVTPNDTWLLIYAGDVKVYENTGSPLRAFLVPQASVIPDSTALVRMAAADFDPRQSVLLADGEPLNGSAPTGEATITHYTPEQVTIETDSPSDAYLVLTDAFYPGWSATVDGTPATVQRGDLVFRAVFVPAGAHTVQMTYTPTSWPGAILAGALAWASLLVITLAAWRRSPARRIPSAKS